MPDYKPYLVAPFGMGRVISQEPWLLPAQAFSVLQQDIAGEDVRLDVHV